MKKRKPNDNLYFVEYLRIIKLVSIFKITHVHLMTLIRKNNILNSILQIKKLTQRDKKFGQGHKTQKHQGKT